MKKFSKIVGLLLLAYLIYLGFTTYPKFDLIAGFSAKNVASAHFIDNRSLDIIEKDDNDINLINLAKNEIQESEKYTTSSVYGLKTRKAIYRKGLGATLINDDFDVSKPYEVPKRTVLNNNLPYPYGNLEPKPATLSDVDYTKLNKVIENAFDKKGITKKRTRAVVVLHNGQLIGERYAEGFNKNSKLLGWSMAKSVTATLFGILQNQGKYDIYKPAPIKEWEKDERAIITTNDLLHMNSGLEWVEDYGKISDVTKMLFQAEDMGTVQIEKPAIFPPNLHWNYSSGTTNLLSKILRNQFKTHQEYLDFWYTALIDKIGMNSMVVETDMSGNYVGSSYAWATTRDWAKFGQLYLNKGNWNGEQLFNESWVKYVSTPTQGSKGDYGAHFWLNAGKYLPDAPKDLFSCNGFQGQKVYIIPSENLVIVRLGLTEEAKFDFNTFLKEIIGSLKK